MVYILGVLSVNYWVILHLHAPKNIHITQNASLTEVATLHRYK